MTHRFCYLTSVGLMLLAPVTLAGEWGQWRGPQRDGVAHESPPLIDRLPETGLRPLWISQVKVPSGGNGGWGSPVVAQGRVYLFSHNKTRISDGELPPEKFPALTEEQRASMSEEAVAEYERQRREERIQRNQNNFRFDELLYCLDANTGETLWINQRSSVFTSFPQSGTPLVAAARVYILGAGLMARCIDAETGEDVWTTQLPGAFRDEHLHSSFALAEGVAVVLANRLFGLDAQSGALRWTASDDLTGQYASPTVWRRGGREWIVVNAQGGHTVCVDPQSGEEIWRLPSGANHSTPVIVGDRLVTYSGSRKGGLQCFDLTQDPPELLWKCQRVADSGSSPVAVAGHVYVQGERRLACVDLESGKVRWMSELNLEQPRHTSLAAADGQVLYAFEGVLSFAANGNDYQELFNGKIDNTGLLASEATFRRKLNMDKLETTAEGQREAQQLWRKTFHEQSPLACASPALADGRLYVRTRTGVACYDLRR